MLEAQQSNRDSLSLFEYPETVHKKRLIGLTTTVGAAYVATSVALYQTWYSDFPRSDFHLFDDWGEWQNMDKMGHVFTAYFQGVMGYKMARWTGLNEQKAITIGVVAGSLFQTTVEIMDGFSSKWGFSLSDMGANVIGSGSFALQQKIWGQQKIMFKISSWPSTYPEDLLISSLGNTTTPATRARDLFGSGSLERFLKDYNAQSYWMSFNINSFIPNSKAPNWLNIAVGYSGENMYGGFENEWEIDGNHYVYDQLPYRQYMLGLDVDLSRIKTNKHFVKALLTAINFYKLPMPAVEFTSQGDISFHLLFKS